MNIEDNKLVKEAMAEKLYKIKNDKGWEIYFRPLKAPFDFHSPNDNKDRMEVITFYQGDPFVNPRRINTDMSRDTNSKDNVEVWSVEEARDAWSAWVEHSDFEREEVEEYLRSGRTNSNGGESINHRKSINTTKENVTMNGKPSSVSDISKALKGMVAE